LAEDNSNWPKHSDAHHKLENIPETKDNNINVMCAISHEEFMVNNYESLTKCFRITAYCLRFINNARTRKNDIKLTGPLIPKELEKPTLKPIVNFFVLDHLSTVTVLYALAVG